MPYNSPHGPSWKKLLMPELVLEEFYSDPPSVAPPYSSILKDVNTQIHLFKRDERIRTNALFPVRLKAGQTKLPAGQFGRDLTPRDLPELNSGKILYNQI